MCCRARFHGGGQIVQGNNSPTLLRALTPDTVCHSAGLTAVTPRRCRDECLHMTVLSHVAESSTLVARLVRPWSV